MFGRKLIYFVPVLNKLSKPLSTQNCCYNNFDYSKSRILCRYYSESVNTKPLTVQFDEVKNAINNRNTLVIDVREPDEIKESGKIPNSINIPVGDVSTALSTMSDSDFQKMFKRPKPTENSEIIFYCKIGKRSGMAQQNALNLGYKNVKNYLGSWTDWKSKTS